MQIKVFRLSTNDVNDDIGQQDLLNKFLRANRILEIRKELIQNVNDSFWSILVVYMNGPSHFDSNASASMVPKPKMDYKEVLPPADFERFCELRKIRKEIAQSEAIPAYAVFTDAELAEICKIEINELSVSRIRKIQGIGEKKSDKYGSRIVEMLQLKSAESNQSS